MFLLIMAGCTPPQKGQPDEGQSPEVTDISTARELEQFFMEGGAVAQLNADIELGGVMLKLEQGRGQVTLQGNGHTVTGDAPCVIRLDNGCSITLQAVTISAHKTGIGLLGGGEIAARDVTINARGDAIQAADALCVTAGSTLSLFSSEGSGIVCAGFTLQEQAEVVIKSEVFAISAGRGDIVIEKNAKAECEARGDNAVKTDSALALHEGSRFIASNTGEHNAAKIGTLEAVPEATLQLKGGMNGVGLFIVEQYETIALKGFCTPEVRVEIGKGEVLFS